MTRIPVLAVVAMVTMCGPAPEPTESPTSALVTPTTTVTPTAAPTPTEPPPTQPPECPTSAPIPYCDLHPGDCYSLATPRP